MGRRIRNERENILNEVRQQSLRGVITCPYDGERGYYYYPYSQ